MFSKRRGDEHEHEALRLEAEIAEVCGLLNATTGRLVRLIAQVLETESWTGVGIRSAEHWVAWQCGVSSGRARRLVAMARRLAVLPEAEAAFSAGELSEDQVSEVVRHTPVHNDGEVTEFARYATVSQLRRVLRTYPLVEPAPEDQSDEAEAATVEERREVSFGHGDDGRWRLHADLPADEGALVERALGAERDRLFREADDGDRITWADAFVAMADRVAASTSAGRAHRNRSLLLVHLDTRADPKGGAVPGAHLHDGPVLPDSLRRYISCDSRVRPVWETDGVAVSVGRALRVVPERTRIVVEERDRGCRVPGCVHSRWLHVHHIVHWEDGGPTDTTNLVCLCPFHHRLHHRGGLGIEGDADLPDGLVFTDQRGRPLQPNAPRSRQATRRTKRRPDSGSNPVPTTIPPANVSTTPASGSASRPDLKNHAPTRPPNRPMPNQAKPHDRLSRGPTWPAARVGSVADHRTSRNRTARAPTSHLAGGV